MRALLVVLVLALAAAAICQDVLRVDTLPLNPHQPMNAAGECFTCHDTYLNEPDPHVFVVNIIDVCMRESCHVPEHIGRSHPVGVLARRSTVVDRIPEHLPLEDGKISCGSCHQPHGDWLSTSQAWERQDPELFLTKKIGSQVAEVPYYRCYYLRVPGTAKDGFLELCNSCHPR